MYIACYEPVFQVHFILRKQFVCTFFFLVSLNTSVASGKLQAHQRKSMDVTLVPKKHCDTSQMKMENPTKKSHLSSRTFDQGR